MLLTTRTVEKPWGRDRLPPPFEPQGGTRVGEIWFEPPAQLPELLVKYLFTSERLSVQVHPDDDQAEAAGLGRQGKEECWLVIDAEPGAQLGVGFVEEIGPEAMRAAAIDGSIEELLQWHPVSAGDFIYIPANTVHAIGAGITIIEIQQNSDITYRLYDYGRPRELHLQDAIAVANGKPHHAALRCKLPDNASASLVEGPYFRLDRICGLADASQAARYDGPLLVIPLRGKALVAGEAIKAGQCALAASLSEVAFNRASDCLIAQPLRN